MIRTEVIRIVLVDDQDLVRAGLERILGSEDDLTIVAQCSDGAQALEAVEATRPDVVVMDIRMRVMNGIEATRRIRDADGPPVLILTTFDDDETLWGAIDAGAAGFVLKDSSAADLIRAVRTVASGAAWLDPQVTPAGARDLPDDGAAPGPRAGAGGAAHRSRARRAAADRRRRDQRRDRRRPCTSAAAR